MSRDYNSYCYGEARGSMYRAENGAYNRTVNYDYYPGRYDYRAVESVYTPDRNMSRDLMPVQSRAEKPKVLATAAGRS